MLNLNVEGMTCGGCARSVERAVKGAVPGAAVTVDLAAGRVAVEGAAGTEAEAVVAAIEEAGFSAKLAQ